MDIRKAVTEDIENILSIYKRARSYMRQSGNTEQWDKNYPGRQLIDEDIRLGACYVCTQEQEIEAVFVVREGDDPTYRTIMYGSWPDNKPYVTIHRLASAGRKKQIFYSCFQWITERWDNIRADTHEDNKIMCHLLEKNGFQICGRIYVLDGSPRVAYQYKAKPAAG